MIKKFSLGSILLLVIIFLYFAFQTSLQKLPGDFVESEGRGHVPDGTKIDYLTNPPTSGAHYEESARPGIYETPVSDGHLVHSLEHGYIIISYNCAYSQTSSSFVKTVYAHEENLESEAPIEPEGSLSGVWQDENCKKLKEDLKKIFDTKKQTKIIVIPRPSLDARIALTAWTRIDKFNEFDQERIIKFIDAFRDKGPEKTME
jgi:hypothetical protein